MNFPARALIAEDEPLLRQALEQALSCAWPQLEIVASVGDGLSAVREALALQPDVLFFDIRMPGQSGLEAAAELADAWPDPDQGGPPFPALVLVTAYDQYAVQAFEAQAMDYVLKPVQAERLRRTVERLQRLLAQRIASRNAAAPQDLEHTMAQLRQLLQAAPAAPAAPAARLTVIQAGAGPHIALVPVDDVLYFEAADKYVRVLTAQQEYLIRTPLKELSAQLDPAVFWQIHRSTLVRASAIRAALRDEAGRVQLQLRGRAEHLSVSRLYAHRFKAM
ncbi:LytTR family DNA-binding domain-containing protein [Pantoea sp. 18069]|uniref:LytR/AlgR family response regulator transcription factor n=1 Tax=Pantoea sp. 18069 TaxID=2681415 RepID=UPI00135B724D|nr:LytTR family DNA-binding domain-containing protein [Pantoea sp. 18069]